MRQGDLCRPGQPAAVEGKPEQRPAGQLAREQSGQRHHRQPDPMITPIATKPNPVVSASGSRRRKALSVVEMPYPVR